MPKIRLHITVIGMVQGIGFRWFVQQTGRDFCLSGWVLNLLGGNVEIEVQGDETEVKRFIETVKNEHSQAVVSNMVIEPMSTMLSNAEFEIKY